MIQQLLHTATIAALLAPSLFSQNFCWSESQNSTTVIAGAGVAGHTAGISSDNRYYRRYNPLARGLLSDFNVTGVSFGVEFSQAGFGAGSQPATVQVFRCATPANPAWLGDLVLLGSEPIQIPDLILAVNTVNFSTPIAVHGLGADDLVIALDFTDGAAAQHSFFFGGNTAGESSPTYVSSTLCGVHTPVSLVSMGFQASQMIFDFCGSATGPAINTYCTAKTTSNACVPSIACVPGDTPSATNAGPFRINAASMINNKNCLLFYGLGGRDAAPFQGGLLCVKTPIKRAPGTNTLGNPPPTDCSGAPVFDMNAFAAGLGGGVPPAALSVPGTTVDCQWWGRDPGFASPNNTQLSNGLEFVIGP